MSNPNVDHATALTLGFTQYQESKLILYPRMDVICESAALFREEASEDSGHSSLASLSGWQSRPLLLIKSNL